MSLLCGSLVRIELVEWKIYSLISRKSRGFEKFIKKILQNLQVCLSDCHITFINVTAWSSWFVMNFQQVSQTHWVIVITISHFAILGTFMWKSDFKSCLKHVMSTNSEIILYFFKNSNKCFPRFSAFSVSIKFSTSEFSTLERNLIFSRGYFPEQCRRWIWHHFQCKTYRVLFLTGPP